MPLQFEYEINRDDYASAQVLNHKLSGTRRKTLTWLVAGVACLVVAVPEMKRGWSPLLLGAVGIWWIWAGLGWSLLGVSARKYFRKHYGSSGVESVRYTAVVDDKGFTVTCESGSWIRRWDDVACKGEDANLFMLNAKGVLFIFAKRYLSPAQQDDLRTLAAIAR
jgi:hypothetical protein